MDQTIRSLFSPEPGIAYLDSATYGLPPEPTIRAMRTAIDGWQSGTADWQADWDRPAEAARSSFAHLIGTTPDRVSLQPAASVGVGLIAAALGPDDEVVVPADEFTSVLFPILVARERGTTVRPGRARWLVFEDGARERARLLGVRGGETRHGRRRTVPSDPVRASN